MSDMPLHIDVWSVKDLLDAGEDFLFLDCRGQNEHERCRIAGTKLLPVGELPNRVGELEACRDKRIVVHCHRGARSLKAALWLREQGFSQAQSMQGGIDAWSLLVDTSIPRY